jgi:Family of unknown function (DUF6152)
VRSNTLRSTAVALSLVLGLATASGVAFAHHSFGHYSMDKTTEIEGIVSKFEWSNPHCWLFVDVVAANGKSVTYGFELQSVGEMLRRGWKKNTVKPGEKLKVKFRPMRDGTPAGLLVSAERDGQRIGSFGGAPPPPPTP